MHIDILSNTAAHSKKEKKAGKIERFSDFKFSLAKVGISIYRQKILKSSKNPQTEKTEHSFSEYQNSIFDMCFLDSSLLSEDQK